MTVKTLNTEHSTEHLYALDEHLHIENAGLVLITPFIKYLFQTLNYTKDNQFWDEETKMRAAVLLDYIVNNKMPENDTGLLLNKILCDIQPTNEIQVDFQLSKSEKDNCNTMLEAVIQNWTALGGTSILGLQNSFLSRHGTLVKNEDTWRLLVTRTSFDLLLDRLPWSFSRVKLPWMSTQVLTEWL